MKVSVIIPTYKPQDYFWECLDSLVSQSFSNNDFEVIIVLNGCSEPWKSNIKYYINTKMSGMNIKFIQTDVAGVSNARNIGLDLAKGQYICFIDDDDFVSSKYIEYLYKEASTDTVAICYPYAFNDGELEMQLSYPMTHVFERNCTKVCSLSSEVRRFFSGPCMKLISKDIIGTRRFDLHFKNGEDSIFMFLISDRIKYCKFTSNDAVYYRRFRLNSAVTSYRPFKTVLLNSYNMMREYSHIYFSNIGNYSIYTYVTSIMGGIKSIIVDILNRIKKK